MTSVADFASMVPQSVLFIFRNPPLDQDIVGVLRFVSMLYLKKVVKEKGHHTVSS